MKIHDNIRTGAFSTVSTSLIRSIAQYVQYSDLKIGITNNPPARASAYRNNTWYEEMILLYRTSSLNYIRNMEAMLVDYFWEECDNTIGGGGGSFGYPPYYLYIVR